MLKIMILIKIYVKIVIDFFEKIINVNNVGGNVPLYVSTNVKDDKVNPEKIDEYNEDNENIDDNIKELEGIDSENVNKTEELEINKEHIIKNEKEIVACFEDIPIVKNYRYLGISLDNSLVPLKHLKTINNKMKIYMKKNKMLMKEFFSLKSLKILHQHFQESRLFYGMSVFLDIPTVVKMLELLKMRYVISIFDLYRQININLIKLTLGMPPVEYLLFPRLVIILKKFIKHFNWRPALYDSIVASYEIKLNNTIVAEKNIIKDVCYMKGIEALSKCCNVKINDKFIKYRKLYFSLPDKRDIILVKFIIKSHIFARYSNKKCLLCGQPNEKDHLFVYCNDARLKKIKDNYFNDLLDKLSEEEKGEVEVKNFYKVIKYLYFNPKEKKDFRKTLIIMKKFTFELAMLLCDTKFKGKKVIEGSVNFS